MKYKKTKIAFLTAIVFFAILTVYPPSIDSYIVRAIDQKATQIGSDLRYDSIRQKWGKIHIDNVTMSKPKNFHAKEIIVDLCFSLQNFIKPCGYELINAKLILSQSKTNKINKKIKHLKSRSFDKITKIPFTAKDLSILITDRNTKKIVEFKNIDIDSQSEKGKFKFKLNKINYRSSTISSNISGYLVTDIKGQYLPFELAYSHPQSNEAWRLDGKLLKNLQTLKFKVKNNGIPEEWKRYVSKWIPDGEKIKSTISGIIKRRPNTNLFFSVENIYQNISIDNSLISDTTIKSPPIKLKLLGFFKPKTGRLKVIKSYIETRDRTSKTPIRLNLAVSKKDVLSTTLADPLEINFSMAKTECSQFFSFIPEGILSANRDFDFSGDLSFDLKLKIPLASLHLLKHKFKSNFTCQFENVPDYLNAELIRSHSLNVFSDPSPQQVAFMSNNYFSLDKISPLLIHSVVSSEDAGYWKHEGFSVPILFSSLKHNLRLKKYAVGGSTISMQLAKNLFLSRDKTISRKINELFLSWYLNETFSKNEILEFYLNAIEFGPNLYGIGVASDFYFAKKPHELNLKEATFLAKILPNPSYYFTNYCFGLNPSFKKKLYSAMSTTMALGMIDTDTYSRGVKSELLFTRNKKWMDEHCRQRELARKRLPTKKL